MTAGRLEFGGAYTPSGRLDFDALAPPSQIDGVISGSLPIFSGAVRGVCILPQTARIRAALPAFQTALVGYYDYNVWRGVVRETTSSYQPSLPVGNDVRCPYGAADPIVSQTSAPWQDALPVGSGITSSYQQMLPLMTDTAGRWRDALPVDQDFSGSYTSMIPLCRETAGRWRDAIPICQDFRSLYFLLIPLDQEIRGSFRDALPLGVAISGGWKLGIPRELELSIPWKNAMAPPPGKSHIGIVPPPPEPECYVPTGRIDFGLVAYLDVSGRLYFRCAPLIPVIPLRPVYIMLHQIAFLRTSDNRDIHASSIRLSVDTDSWAWGLTATVIGRPSADAIDPNENGGPVEVELFIDGYRWRFWIDKVTRSRAFPGAQYQATGRSLGAELAEPWYPSRNFVETNPRTAQQLAVNEVPEAWEIDWNLTDWLVPGGVWSYQGLTPVRAVKQIAQAAGGFAICDRRLRTIHVRPTYKVVPWTWVDATPDRTIPADILTKIDTEWLGGTEYEAVWVQGQAQGRAVNYRRSGTAGLILAESVVDPLITHVDAGRQRAEYVLASSRPHGTVTFEMPISTEIPLMDLGELIWIEDTDSTRHTVARAIDVSVEWRNGPVVRQNVTLEEHV